MVSYYIAIPSYKRAEICRDQTLTMLQKNNIPPSVINIFVVPEEVEHYIKTIPKDMYNKIIPGKLGIIQQRAFAHSQYPDGAHILFIDDDIRGIDMSCSIFTDLSLDVFIRQAFQECLQQGANIWGIYPVNNQYFMIKQKEEVTTSLKFIVGCFYGVINQNQRALPLPVTSKHLSYGQKDDVERTIRYFERDGKVVRYNKITMLTKFYGTTGGLGNFKVVYRAAGTCA